jgi:DNA invertase Pin-like site-specific DNA recombinase
MNTQDRTDQIIVELLANELTPHEIAKEFGVSYQLVYGINNGRYGRIPGFNYPVRRMTAKRKEKPTDMEVWHEDCYEVKL